MRARAFACVLVLAFPALASAHAFDPIVVVARERPDGAFDLHASDRGVRASVRERTLVVEGLDPAREAVVRVTFAAGGERRAILRADAPTLDLSPVAPPGRAARDYARLGVVHILTGWDHLLFLLGLVLLVRRPRAVLLAATAFTVAHSLTLALATFGWLTLPPAPVEALIALSIVALAVELTRGDESLLSRAPGVAAFAFGLLHGLGFAGALGDLGVDPRRAVVELFAFNCGVEAGQLAFLLPCLLVAHRLPRRPTAYFLGSLGSALAIARVAGFWSVG